jgi:dTDP-4-amino-4,6-dideoxygalactose transaminase
MRLHGMSRDGWKRYTAGGKWRYEILETGFKYNLTDLQAALGLVQLGKAEFLRARRDALRIDRDQMIVELRTRGIGSAVHFIPLHYHP